MLTRGNKDEQSNIIEITPLPLDKSLMSGPLRIHRGPRNLVWHQTDNAGGQRDFRWLVLATPKCCCLCKAASVHKRLISPHAEELAQDLDPVFSAKFICTLSPNHELRHNPLRVILPDLSLFSSSHSFTQATRSQREPHCFLFCSGESRCWH